MTVDLTRTGDIATLTIDNPPVNSLGATTRIALRDGLVAVLADADVAAIVIAGAGRHFSAGADIREFSAPVADAPNLPEVIEQLESASKVVVAAVHGTVAGGALELVLACHHRVAAANTQLSSPEVTLGFVPGAGATQRLPRLLGVAAALDLILTGRKVGAAAAAAMGLVDEVADGEVTASAVALARRVLEAGQPLRRTSQLEAGGSADVFAKHEEKLATEARRFGGLEAPRAALECVRESITVPFADGLRKEREAFERTLGSPESKALRHVFFAERQVRKIPGLSATTATRPIRSAGVVGFGTMGRGIAMCFANADIPVTVLETDQAALDRGLDAVAKTYERAQSKGRLSAEQARSRRDRVKGTRRYDDLAAADIVIEAVFEELAAKRDVFARLDAVCDPDAILATNTSSLDVNSIAAATARPERVLGTHFFSPAHVMRLLEIVRPDGVSPTTLATAVELGRTLGKVAVVVGVCDGFVGNRMLFAYRRQADFMLEEGALPEHVDRAIRDFGLPMGPYQMGDLAGLDISWRIRKRQAATRPSDQRYSEVADRLCERGRLGQKTGAGWYRYEPGSRDPIPDPEVADLIRSVSAELGLERREIRDEEIVERCLYPLINEGALILEEGLASRASDIDVIWIHGYGFPRYRGGPMFYADSVGLPRIAEVIRRLHDEQGELVPLSPLLSTLASEGRGFSDLDRGPSVVAVEA